MENINEREFILIAETVIPTPTEYSISVETIVDRQRNTNGKTIGQIIRDGIRTISMSWNYLTVEQWADILKLFNPRFYNGSFVQKVGFFCSENNEFMSASMYVSNRESNLAQLEKKTGEPVGWIGCSLSLTEV